MISDRHKNSLRSVCIYRKLVFLKRKIDDSLAPVFGGSYVEKGQTSYAPPTKVVPRGHTVR